MREKENQYALKYKAHYANELLEHMSKGLSLSSFNVEPSVSRSTIYQWLHDHDDFAMAKELGKQKHLMRLELCLIVKAFGLTEDIQKKYAPELEEINPLLIDDRALLFLLKRACPKEYA